jgi:hypothetical protein
MYGTEHAEQNVITNVSVPQNGRDAFTGTELSLKQQWKYKESDRNLKC